MHDSARSSMVESEASGELRASDIGKDGLHLVTEQHMRQQLANAEPAKDTTDESEPNTPRVNGASPYAHRYAGSTDSLSDGMSVRPSLSRTGSIYTLGRASLQGQLSHLTSLKLPDANSLAKRISSIPTSSEACKALADASEQIRLWISKASDVLKSLNAEDDVEWAAAGGREGIEDVDKAISRFETLVEVYIASIERLQTRDDVATLSAEELTASVLQMESIISSWKQVKDTLRGVKIQVEVAMEWEELWNTVLGEIGQEMDGLNRLVFEMEEKRHSGAEGLLSSKDSLDITELETIVEERPGRHGLARSNRLSVAPFAPSSPMQQPTADDNKDDSSLLALFARMQPLRASLDFLPMRLYAFHTRGNEIFPSACSDLKDRQDQLEAQWSKLESDAESLRRELGEDRWVLVFRNAGRQALKMCESITRSFGKLREGVDSREPENNPASFAKKTENFEAKKTHYGPAIERVLAIIDRGVTDRLTVNGEILRLQSDMKRMWNGLQTEMRDMDTVLGEVSIDKKEKQLRDSVSTVLSSDRSLTSSFIDTPGSSPASSVVGNSRKGSFQGSRTPTLLTNSKTRKSSQTRSGSRAPNGTSLPRRMPLSSSISRENSASPSPSPLTVRAINISTRSQGPSSETHRPRWTGAMKNENRDFLPLSTLEPSKYAKTPVAKKTNFLRSSSTPSGPAVYTSSLRPPVPTRNISTPSKPPPTPTTPLPRITVVNGETRTSSLPIPTNTTPRATPRAASAMGGRPSLPTPNTRSTTPGPRRGSMYPPAAMSNRRNSMLPTPAGPEAGPESPSLPKTRPASSMASRSTLAAGKRVSTLPTATTPKARRSSLLPTPAREPASVSPVLKRSRPSSVTAGAQNPSDGRRSSMMPLRPKG